MRRSDRELSEDEALELMRSDAPYCVLSCVGGDGLPYGTPLSFACVGRTLYVHGTPEGGLRAECLARNPEACVTVVARAQTKPAEFTVGYASAIGYGQARPVNDPDEKRRALGALIEKYSSDYRERGARYIDGAVAKTSVTAIDLRLVTGKGCA